MNICHIASGDLWAGAEVLIFNYMKQIASNKENTYLVILFNDFRLSKELKRLGINVIIIDEKKINLFLTAIHVKQVLKREHIKILHSHGFKANLITFLALFPFSRIKKIVTLHGMPELYKNQVDYRYRLFYWFNLLVLRINYHAIVCVSDDMKKSAIEKFHFKTNLVYTIHNGIEINNYKMRQFKKKDKFIFGLCGRLNPVKNIILSVEICKLLSIYTEINFVLAGTGPEKCAIENLVNKYNLASQYLLLGHIDELTVFYETIDVLINTSFHEGLPMSILEAMNNYIPVIAPAIGGIPEIVENGKEGFLIEVYQAQKFAEKCEELFKNRKLFQSMQIAAWEKVRNKFKIKETINKYESLYHKMLDIKINVHTNTVKLPS
jgi:L-malate glycosyltransferase